MKLLSLVVAFAVAVAIMMSCHKSNNTITAPASLNIVNAIAGSQPVIPVLGTTDTIQYYSSAASIGYGSTLLYSPLSGSNIIYVVQKTDTAPSKEKLFNGTLSLEAGGIYSFFLSGDTTKADTLLVQDHIPVYSDSSAGVRFVNLSSGSQPFNVTLVGNDPSQTEFSGLGYRQISSFKSYIANSSVVGNRYTFVIRDQATGDSLMKFAWNYPRFKNNTLVIAGMKDSVGVKALKVFSVNNY
ncbi:MAG TPA: DUF4397 domain-containing protein [Puia sp.]|nr:DUF4397 domain-containing protein [Puia sp.]